jgi:hypothetical protein
MVTLEGDVRQGMYVRYGMVWYGCAGCCVFAALLCWQPVGREQASLGEALLDFFLFPFCLWRVPANTVAVESGG